MIDPNVLFSLINDNALLIDELMTYVSIFIDKDLNNINLYCVWVEKDIEKKINNELIKKIARLRKNYEKTLSKETDYLTM